MLIALLVFAVVVWILFGATRIILGLVLTDYGMRLFDHYTRMAVEFIFKAMVLALASIIVFFIYRVATSS